MLKTMGAVLLAAGVLTAAGSGAGIAKTAPKPAKAAAVPTVNNSMTQVMAVQAQTIWDISSKAFNNRGDGLDPRKLDANDWKKLGEAGRLMKERATLLATARHVVAAGPDEHILGEEAAHGGVKKTWDAASAKQIQALIDAQPKKFSEHAWTLARAAESLEKAARTRDVKTVYKVSANLDEDCDGCHKPFWGTDEPPAPPKNVPVIKGR
ncbi:MAG: hypothetical protein ACXU82_20260 [Caulobacteraceae bacterium]